MSEINFRIKDIFGGWSTTDFYNSYGQFLCSLGIDPDMPSLDTGNKPCGYIRPTVMAKFSGTNVNAVPMFILTNPKDTKIYVVLSNGKIISYSATLTSETLVGTLSSCIGQGAEYYDNYLYFRKNLDVARYGPLNGTPSLTQNFWTSTLSLTAPRHVTYPTINGVKIPNGQMHRYTNGKLYFCDVLSSNKGALHYVKTKKTTVEGDTDDTSVHTALNFNYGEYPVCIETYQTDLVVALIEGVNTSMMRGKLSFWDASSVSVTSITSIEAPKEKEIFTAIKNVNGTLYAFSGFITGGCRVSRLISGYQLEEVVYLPEEYPPVSSGAVDHIINRFVWGSNCIKPTPSGCVFAIGSKEQKLTSGLQNIIRITNTGDNAMATAVKYVQSDGKIVMPIVGWKSDSGYGIDKITTGGGTGIFRSEVVIVDNYSGKLSLKQIRIPFIQKMTADMSFTIYLYVDGALNSRTWTIDGSKTSYKNKLFAIVEPEISFDNNFFIQIEFSGSDLLTIGLPITGTILLN